MSQAVHIESNIARSWRIESQIPIIRPARGRRRSECGNVKVLTIYQIKNCIRGGKHHGSSLG